ncbi:MAG TPA: FAD-binding oxidoreductase, partial [Solirubrobacteraceae bacterium]|nr:FAD-binding oxidoreductase [Solirubrobacteraceae bacterium]
VRGRVLAPGDGGYAAARVLFNTRFDGIRPPAVVRVRDSADVQAAVRWAARFDVPLVARSGGNAYNGSSTSASAVVIDVGALDTVAVDGGRVVLGPGGRLLPVQARLARRGLTFPAGSCPNVAVGGHALGGGFGLSGRAHGLALDRIRAIRVVTADGRRRRVTARDGEELFWALRGGGGSFGIVVAFEIDPVRATDGAWFRVTYPAAQREEALAAFDGFAPAAAPELTSILGLTPSGAQAFGQFLGSERRMRRLLGPLTRVAGASLSTGAASHMTLMRRWAACATQTTPAQCAALPRQPFAASSVYVTDPVPAEGRRAFARAADTGATLLCDAYGGAVSRRTPDATAFVHRDVRFSVQVLRYAAIGTAVPEVARARRLIAPFGNGHAYQNYPDPGIGRPLRAYYGANLARLRAVKEAVDPGGRFRPAQGVRA